MILFEIPRKTVLHFNEIFEVTLPHDADLGRFSNLANMMTLKPLFSPIKRLTTFQLSPSRSSMNKYDKTSFNSIPPSLLPALC